MIKEETKYKLFNNLRTVKGFNRSIIIDFQRDTFFFIPNVLEKILKNTFTVSSIIDEFAITEKDEVILKSYVDFLNKNELIFKITTLEPLKFPEIQDIYETPNIIDNIIIELENFDNLNTELFKDVTELGCKNIEFRVFNKMTFTQLISFVSKLSFFPINNIFITTELFEDFSIAKFLDNKNKLKNIQNLTFYGCNENNNEFIEETTTFIKYLKAKSLTNDSCGNCSLKLFNLNIKHFLESQTKNTCLNKKMSINIKGEIKNCPSFPNIYGNINNHDLLNIAKSEEFNQFWNIKKDEIQTCRDCEFRHICTDCRAFIIKKKDIFSKPLKCEYNPYTNIWSK